MKHEEIIETRGSDIKGIVNPSVGNNSDVSGDFDGIKPRGTKFMKGSSKEIYYTWENVNFSVPLKQNDKNFLKVDESERYIDLKTLNP